MANLNVTVLGGGSWGTTVASLVARNAPITLWARNPTTVAEINTHHTNEVFLPGAILPEKLFATTDLGKAVRGADVIVMGIPSQNFRQVLLEVKKNIRAWVPVISLTKGLELDTRMRMTEIITEVLPGHPVGVLTGPNLAQEIIAGQAAASVIAMEDEIIVQELQTVFKSGLFRTYTNTDVIGCELGGVLKNIIAIAVGMGDGQGAGDNTRAGLITRGLAEVTRLGVAMGGQAETFAGLAGMGDMIATCTSPSEPQPPRGHSAGHGAKHGGDCQRDGHGGRGSQECAGRARTGRTIQGGYADFSRCLPRTFGGYYSHPYLPRPSASRSWSGVRTRLMQHQKTNTKWRFALI